MTEHDTTDHVAAIREALNDTWGTPTAFETITEHLDALAAALAAAEAERDAERAKVARLQAYAREVERYGMADQWGDPDLSWILVFRDESLKDGTILPGDLPATDGSDDDAE